MPHAFAEIAFTPKVKDAQQRDGSRAGYARSFEGDAATFNDRLRQAEVDFITRQRSFYMAIVPETGWSCVQHRGGPAGFVQVLDERHIAFADCAGNRQLISVGNLAGNERLALIAVDYTQRVRLKLLGTMAVRALADDPALSLLGLPYELIEVDLMKAAHKRPEFLALNPFGQVPVLDDASTVLFDSNAILVYLASTYDADRRWLLRDAKQQAAAPAIAVPARRRCATAQ